MLDFTGAQCVGNVFMSILCMYSETGQQNMSLFYSHMPGKISIPDVVRLCNVIYESFYESRFRHCAESQN